MKFKVAEIASVQMGYSFRSRLKASRNGDVAVIQMKDLSDDDTVNCNDLKIIDMEAVKEHHLVQRGDLVFRSRGLLSTAAIITEYPGKAVVCAPLFRIRITAPEKILAEYLNWYIRQRDAQIFFASRAKGTVQQMISKEAIEELELFLPDLQKQKAVVELADLASRERKLAGKLAEKREQYISTVLMHIAQGE